MIWLPGDEEKTALLGPFYPGAALAGARDAVGRAVGRMGQRIRGAKLSPGPATTPPATTTTPPATTTTTPPATKPSRLSRFPWLPVGLGVAGVGALGALAAGKAMSKQTPIAPEQPGGSTYS